MLVRRASVRHHVARHELTQPFNSVGDQQKFGLTFDCIQNHHFPRERQ
jgi:hypothetical protein